MGEGMRPFSSLGRSPVRSIARSTANIDHEREVAIYRHEWAYRSERAVRELGYVARPLEDGVARTVAWLRETGALARR